MTAYGGGTQAFAQSPGDFYIWIDKYMIEPGEEQTISATLISQHTGEPIVGTEIEFRVTYPSGNQFSFYSTTDYDGVAYVDFDIREDASYGHYSVRVSAPTNPQHSPETVAFYVGMS
jgi:uncharacterized protein YfaS (alpha-2-macroglobulin family)